MQLTCLRYIQAFADRLNIARAAVFK